MLERHQATEATLPADEAGWDALALAAVRQKRADQRFVPGLGHPVHKVTDPRTPVLIEIAEAEGLRGPHLRLFEAIGRVHGRCSAAGSRSTARGSAAPPSPTSACPSNCCAASPCWPGPAGLLGQIAEERRRPIGMDAYLTIDRNAVYVEPDPSPPDHGA